MGSNRRVIEIREDMDALYDVLLEIENPEVLESDEVQEVFESLRKELDTEFASKMDSIAAMITNLQAMAKVRKDEASRLARLAEIDENKAKYVKEWVKQTLQSMDVPKLKTDRYNITVANNGGKQPLEITGDVPPDYLTVTQVSEVNKDLIRHRLDSGDDLGFARYLDRGTHLRIK